MDIPGYEIVEMLGAGGFGSVYRARQLAVRREVALKIDSRALATDRDRRRFMREVTAAGRLSGHPHVVAVYDAGVLADGRPYIVLELCPGGSLNDRLHDAGPFPPAEVRDIGVRVADALAAAHAAGVLHRDVKPANILVDGYGNVALADFGLASMPSPGMESSATREALTPAYAPPEAFRLGEPGPAGDVYSLAASLYALLSGRPPHFPPDRQLGIAELMEAQRHPVPAPPGAPPALVEVLRRAMAFDRDARIPDAAAFRDALAAADLAAGALTAPAPAAAAPAPAPAAPAPAPMAMPAPAGPGHATDPAYAGTTQSETVRAPRGQAGVSRGLVLGAAALVGAGILGAGALVAFAGQGPSGGAPGAKAGVQGTQGGSSGGGAGGGAAASKAADAKAAERRMYGVDTVTANCPAAQIAGAKARCTLKAECWGGMVTMNGWIFSHSRIDCSEPHRRETFAIGLMPSDGQTGDINELARHPTVRKVCSRTVLLRSLQGAAAKYRGWRWEADPVPPEKQEFSKGVRVFRCEAVAPYPKTLTRGTFRPR